jgi:hypothetical protein
MSTITSLLFFPDSSPELMQQIKTFGPIRCLPNPPVELIDPSALLGALVVSDPDLGVAINKLAGCPDQKLFDTFRDPKTLDNYLG